jgi:cytochrome c55X
MKRPDIARPSPPPAWRRMLETAALAAMIVWATTAAGEALIDRAKLRHLVVQDCGSCHGLRLTGGLGSPLTREALAHLPPEALTEIILQGIPGTPMPPWTGLLSRTEAAVIADMLSKGDLQ